MPGGVNSPVRAFRPVGGDPVFVASGEGAWIVGVDGRRYLDLVGGYGPMLLGHAHPAVVDAIQAQASRGTAYGAPTEAETDLAELLVECVPSVEMVRLVNSGTEAAMSAIRLARAATGRELVVKFAGGYHGHSDGLLADAGSGVATLGIPGSPGVPAALAALCATLRYNDAAGVEAFAAEHGDALAAVIVEPVAGNMGVVPGSRGFLEALRRACDASGAILIFDEVITGFRLGSGGAQAMLGVLPDLTLLGKVIGGGLPLAAYGGRRDLMRLVAPEGPVYQAGTLSGNPLAVAAGIATLRRLVADPPYERLDAAGARIQAALERGGGGSVNRVGSMLTPFQQAGPVRDYDDAKRSDTAAYARLFHALLDAGVYLPPSQYEAWFLNAAMEEEELSFLEAALAATLTGGANV